MQFWQKKLFYNFKGKYYFAIFTEKRHFARKLYFAVFLWKTQFCSFSRKRCFPILAEKRYLKDWRKNSLRFWRQNAVFMQKNVIFRKTLFSGLAKNIILLFCWKCYFTILAGKRYFAILRRKWYLTVLAGTVFAKTSFLQFWRQNAILLFEEKTLFCYLRRKLYFVVFCGNVIL